MSYANFVQCQLASALSSEQFTIELQDAVAPFQLPPLTGGVLVLTDSTNKPSTIELIGYASRNGLVLSGVKRGLEGTAALAWPSGSYCYQSMTAGEFTTVSKTAKKAYLNQLLELGI